MNTFFKTDFSWSKNIFIKRKGDKQISKAELLYCGSQWHLSVQLERIKFITNVFPSPNCATVRIFERGRFYKFFVNTCRRYSGYPIQPESRRHGCKCLVYSVVIVGNSICSPANNGLICSPSN